MKRSAALQLFVTAWILLVVVGIQYSTNHHKRSTLIHDNQAQLALAKLDDGVITVDSLDREARVLRAIAGVAGCLLLASPFLLGGKKETPQPAALPVKRAA